MINSIVIWNLGKVQEKPWIFAATKWTETVEYYHQINELQELNICLPWSVPEAAVHELQFQVGKFLLLLNSKAQEAFVNALWSFMKW